MSSSKEPPVDDGPIPFGNSGQPNGGQQGFFGSQQNQQQNPQSQPQPQPQQQQQQQISQNMATGLQGAAPLTSSGVPTSASGNVIYGGNQQAQLHQPPANGDVFFDQYQDTTAPSSQANAQQQGATLTQPYDPSLYQTHQHYAESVMSSDMGYQQQYQSFDQAQQQYQQQYQQQPYDASQQQYNYSHQQYDYTQQAYAYTAPQQQQYDYSQQQQQQYDYNQQSQYNYGQQQYDYSQQQAYDVNQQQYDASQQQQYDSSQQQQYDSSQQQQYGSSQQQQYDSSQQQPYDVNQQQYNAAQPQESSHDSNQQQIYRGTSQQEQQNSNQDHQQAPHDIPKQQQQQHDAFQQFDASQQYEGSQVQQYDTSQQYDHVDKPLANQQQLNEKSAPLVPEPDANTVNWGEWDDQQVPTADYTEQSVPNNVTEAPVPNVPDNSVLPPPAQTHGKDDQQEKEQKHEQSQFAQDQQLQHHQQYYQQPQEQFEGQAQGNINYENQLMEDQSLGQQQEQLGASQQPPADHSQPIYEYEDKEGYQHVNIQPPAQQYGGNQVPIVDNQQPHEPLDQQYLSTEVQQQQQQQQQLNVTTTPAPQAHTGDNEKVNNGLGVQPDHLLQNYGVSTPIMSSRINSPQPDSVTMVPCPDPNCEGENKPKAKFCSECGRPLSTLSRTSTPAMASFSPQFNPYLASPSYSMHQQPHQFYYGQQGNQPYYDFSAQQGKQGPVPDPLQRNKGCPLATFGFGGKLCLMFPSKLNIQDANAKIMPGLVQVKQVKELVLPNATALSDFVGPILLDSSVDLATKKQDAIAYMDRRMDDFYTQLQSFTQESADYYHLENKILLWQLVKLLIQEDFSGDSERKGVAIRTLLQPGEFVVEGDSLAMVRNYLLQGDRSNAIQYAIQEKMWSHGLIISKSIDQPTWINVVHQFLEQALSTTVDNEHTEFYQNVLGDRASLRVLYSLFAGAGVDAVSQFIPKYSSKSIEHQLSEWRETVALILANRTEESNELIRKLGDLMKTNGWIDAAEICYAVSSNMYDLVDDALLPVELLGSQDGDVFAPLDSLYLTELYEFALSLDQQKNTTILPFLQGYKLVHAWWLADAGYVQEASRYLQAIVDGLLSYDKPTLYMHQGFLENLKEFNGHCRGSIEASLGNDLDASLQQLEAKLNNAIGVYQDQTTTDSTEATSHQQTTELSLDAGVNDQKRQETGEELPKDQDGSAFGGYEAIGEDGTQIQYTGVDYDYTAQYQYDESNGQYVQHEQQQQVDYNHSYDAYPHQQQQQESDWHAGGHLANGNEVETTESSHQGPPTQPVSSSLPVDEATPQQENQPATLPTMEDYSASSYSAHNTSEYTTQYGTQEYTATYTDQDTTATYIGHDHTTTYQTQDYTTSYESQSYGNTYEAQDMVQETADVDAPKGVTEIPAPDLAQDAPPAELASAAQETSQNAYNAEDLTHDYSSTYGAPPPTTSETAPSQDFATSHDAQYTTVPESTSSNDHSAPYETDATGGFYGSESAEVPNYNQDYTSSSYGAEPISYDDDTGKPKSSILDDDDDELGLGNSSTKKAQLDDKKDDDKQAQTVADTPKDGKATDDEDEDEDKQDRKGWGLFSMFSRASPAPMEKDEKKAVKANLGESSSFYFDEKEGRWVNKNVSDSPAAPAKLPPPPKASGPKPSTPKPSTPTATTTSTDPVSAASPTPPPSKTATSPSKPADGPRPPLTDIMNNGPPSANARRGPASGKKKPMRSRYIDVFNTPAQP